MIRTRTRILIIDKYNAYHDELIEQLHYEGYILDYVDSIGDLAQELLKNPYYLLMVNADSMANEISDILLKVKGNVLLSWVPVLLLAHEGHEERTATWLHMGADDYWIGRENYTELKIRMRNLTNRSKEFEKKAFRDPLTGAYSRGYFNDRIQYELEQANETDQPISLAFIDADRFKSINDTFGHDVGDLVLQGLSKLLVRNISSGDILARYGGEEFVILFPRTDQLRAYDKVRDILAVAHREPVAEHDEQQRFITFSGGVAAWLPGKTLEQWIKCADEAAYMAKSKGRDQICHGVW